MNFKYCANCGQKGTVNLNGTTEYICSSCDWHFWNNPKASVTTLFVKDNQILTAVRASTYSRQDLNGQPELIGGFIGYNENHYDAARREAWEELGVEITEIALLDIWNLEYDSKNMPPVSVTDCVFVVTGWKGTPKPRDDVSALVWRPLEAVEDPAQAFKYPGILAKLKKFLAERASGR
jgi:8-oxo-dGTP pyrophosphatase MutT (NUDIX family)